MIDSLFENILPSSPGAAIVVVDSGKIAYQNYYGLANLEHGIPVCSDTKLNFKKMIKNQQNNFFHLNYATIPFISRLFNSTLLPLTIFGIFQTSNKLSV